MPFPTFSEALTSFGSVAPGIGEIVRNYTESTENRDRASDAAATGEQEWSGDRTVINNEWSRLSQGFEGEYAPATATKEAFKTWTHQRIWEALNGGAEHSGVASGDINAGADGWRRLTEDLFLALEAFGKNTDTAITEMWDGQTAKAAIDGTRAFVADAQKLVGTFEMVANGIDLVQGYLAQSKMSIVPPVEVSGFDEFVGHIPGNGVIKAAKHRANEATAQAQDLMIEFYQPGVTEVDGRTPVLPVTKSPVGDGPGDPGSSFPSGPPSGAQGAGPGGGVPGAGAAPGDTGVPTPGTPDPAAPGDATGPAGTETSATAPATTAPAATVPMEDPVGRPNTTTPSGAPSATGGPPMGGSPMGGAPMGGAPGGPAPGGPGKTLGGAPNQHAPAAPGAKPPGASAAAARGMAGAPMMGGGGQRGRGDDEEEHQTPDYLVQDRSSELLGEQPRVLPPGGVIGG